MQDDVLNPNLTVEVTLSYTARLRLPPELTPEDIQDRVEDAMTKMGITHTRDTIVGSPMLKGISGGERKRLCVAMELLAQPKLLFLDEPTSGLDSVAALSLCKKLKTLSDSGDCTIVCTIHQPQAKIFALFDNLILLHHGNVVYSGVASKAKDHFKQIGYPCPRHENPADHLMDALSQAFPNSTQLDSKDYAELSSLQDVSEKDLAIGSDRPPILPRDTIPWYKQFMILFERAWQEQLRKYDIMLIQLLETIIIAVLVGTVYLNIGIMQDSVTKRQAALFFCCVNQGVFGALIVINSFPRERVLVLRERAAGIYFFSAYFYSKILVEGFWQLPYPIVFSCIVYWLVGFQDVAVKFFVFMPFMLLCHFGALGLGTAISALARTTEVAVVVLPLVLEICRLFGGFYLSPATLPGYFVWLDAMSYLKYTYTGISLNELTGLEYNCTAKQLINATNSTPAHCPVSTGNQTIYVWGFQYLSSGGCAGVLLAYIVGFYLISFMSARTIKW